MNYKKIGELCHSVKKSVKPEESIIYNVFSLPGFDNKQTPEKLAGSDIKSNKFKVFENSILFNKLNVKYRRIWNIHELKTENNISSTEFIPLVVEKGVDQDYLYYCLRSDDVTSAMHAARKGTSNSQQRIDENILFSHAVPVPDYGEQKKIASVLRSIDEKIRTNEEINDNLLQQAFTLFDNQFSDITAGDCSISDYILPRRGRGLLSKDAIKGDVPVVAGGLEPATYHNVANTTSPVLTISASGANAGFIRLWNIPVWSSDSSFIDSSMTDFVYFWFILLKKCQDEIYGSQTGSAQPHIYPQNIGALPISELNMDELKQYNDLVSPLFAKIGANELENIKLANLRDTLLPKLMAGELDLDSLNG